MTYAMDQWWIHMKRALLYAIAITVPVLFWGLLWVVLPRGVFFVLMGAPFGIACLVWALSPCRERSLRTGVARLEAEFATN